MKVKIKSYYGSLPVDLSLEKIYVDNRCEKYPWTYDVIDDDDYMIGIKLDNCAHLNGGSWEIVEE